MYNYNLFTFRRFSTKCYGCNLPIMPKELLRKVRKHYFHLSCFVCSFCSKELETGDELYVTPDNKLICREDYLTAKGEIGKLTPCSEMQHWYYSWDRSVAYIYIFISIYNICITLNNEIEIGHFGRYTHYMFEISFKLKIFHVF